MTDECSMNAQRLHDASPGTFLSGRRPKLLVNLASQGLLRQSSQLSLQARSLASPGKACLIPPTVLLLGLARTTCLGFGWVDFLGSWQSRLLGCAYRSSFIPHGSRLPFSLSVPLLLELCSRQVRLRLVSSRRRTCLRVLGAQRQNIRIQLAPVCSAELAHKPLSRAVCCGDLSSLRRCWAEMTFCKLWLSVLPV